MVNTGVIRLALVNDQDSFNVQLVDTLIKAFETGGRKEMLGLRTTVPIGTKDFRTQIAKIKADKPKATSKKRIYPPLS